MNTCSIIRGGGVRTNNVLSLVKESHLYIGGDM